MKIMDRILEYHKSVFQYACTPLSAPAAVVYLCWTGNHASAQFHLKTGEMGERSASSTYMTFHFFIGVVQSRFYAAVIDNDEID
jgi:hypothetical protein